MGVIQTILGALGGHKHGTSDPNTMHDVLTDLFLHNGGMRGLMNRFSSSGHGDLFASWVASGENRSASPELIQEVLGANQIQTMAAKLGIDPQQAARFLAEHLPDVVDRLTPTGHIEPGLDLSKELTAIMPTVLPNFAAAPR